MPDVVDLIPFPGEERMPAPTPSRSASAPRDIVDSIPFPGEEPSESGEFTKGLKAGVQQLKVMGQGIKALTGTVIGSESMVESAREGIKQAESETPAPAVASVTDIESPSDLSKYLAYGVASNLPNLAASMLTGGAGGLAGNILGKRAAAGLIKGAASEVIKKSTTRGAVTGAFGASLGMEAGSISADQLTEAGEVSPGRAIAGALPAAALDVIPEWYLAKKFGWLGDPVFKGKGLRNRAVYALNLAGKGFLMEAPTETMQSVIERQAVPGKSISNKEAWDEYLNSFVLGGATGGVVGGVGGAAARAAKVQEAVAQDPVNKAIDEQLKTLPEESAALGIIPEPVAAPPPAPEPAPEAQPEVQPEAQPVPGAEAAPLAPSPEAASIIPETGTEADFKSEADRLGVRYDAMQPMGEGKIPLPQFSDPETQTTFYMQPGETLEQAITRKKEQKARMDSEVQYFAAQKSAFSSKLTDVVSQKMSGKMSADQLRKMLKNNGVTDAEIENALGNVTGNVTKQQVLDEIKVNSTEFTDKTPASFPMYAAGQQSAPAPITLASVQAIFPGQEVIQPSGPSSPIYVKTRGGSYFTVDIVSEISPDELAFKMRYGVKFDKGKYEIGGAYHDGVISLVRGKSGTLALRHESYHLIEDPKFGILTKEEIAAISLHVKREIKAGNITPVNPETPGNSEDRAFFVSSELENAPPRKGVLGRALDKIRQFLSRLMEAFTGQVSVDRVLEDIRSGKIYNRPVARMPSVPDTASYAATFKESISRQAAEFLDRPSTMPKTIVNRLDNLVKSRPGYKHRFLRYAFDLPYQMSQRHKDWEDQWNIQIERIEDRSKLTHDIVKIAAPFLDAKKFLKAEDYTNAQVKDAVYRVGRVLTIGDDKLRDVVHNLKVQINSPGTSNMDKERLQRQVDWYTQNRRYADNELTSGIPDYDGTLIKLSPKEIEMYASVRKAEDTLWQTQIDNLSLMAFRTYRNQKWFHLLSAASGADLTAENVQVLLGKGLHGAALDYAKSIKPDLDAIFDRIDAGIEEVPESEKKSAAELYEKLSTKLTADLASLRKHLSVLTGEKDPAKLINLTREVFDAYRMTRPQLKKIKSLRNNVNNWIGFFPRMRDQGNYKITLTRLEEDPDSGDMIKSRELYSDLFNTRAQAEEKFQNIISEYGDKDGNLPENMSVDFSPATNTPEGAFHGVSDINLQKIMDTALESVEIKEGRLYDKEGKIVSLKDDIWDATYQAIANQLLARGSGRHFIHRKQAIGERAIKGYKETDHNQILLHHISSMVGLITKQRAAFDALGKMHDLQDPSLFSELKEYLDGQFRNEVPMDKMSAFLRSLAFSWFLGGVVKSAAVNSTQPVIVGIPMLARYIRDNKLGTIGTAESIQLKASFDLNPLTGKRTSLEDKLLDELVTSGVAVDQYIRAIQDSAAFSTYRLKTKQAFDFLAKPFSLVEIYNRKSSGLAMFRTAFSEYIKQGMPEPEAYERAKEDAKKFINDVHYPMGKHNLPLAAQSGNLLGIGMKTAYTFRTFTHNFILNMIGLMRVQGKDAVQIKSDLKTVIHTMTYLALFGGMMGLPFIKDLMQWFEKQYGYSPERYVRKTLRGVGGSTLETFGINGIPAMLGANLSGSLAIGLPFMGEEWGSTIGGVYGGMLQKGVRAGEALGRGDLYRVAANLAPEMLRGPITAIEESAIGKELTGSPGYATTTRGRPFYGSTGKPLEMESGEAFFKLFGFTPTQYNREKEMSRTVTRLEQWVLDQKRDIAETYRVAKINKDPKALRNMISSVKELNNGIRSRKLQRLVPMATVANIIESSRKMQTKTQRRERVFKRTELS